MTYQEPLSQKVIAIAVSDSQDMAALGLAPEHLRDAMVEIARHLLAMGARLVYGGDLRANGFTELLFELVARYRRDADLGDARPAVANYLAWPIVVSHSGTELRQLAKELTGLAELHCLDRAGGELSIDGLDDAARPQVTDADWADALTAMRAVLTRVSDARVVLGGRVEGYKGRMPGIAEEALTALDAGQPLFLLGGFGGCARDIAAMLGISTAVLNVPAWTGREKFRSFDSSALRNGLTAQENTVLARTVHVDEAVALMLRGLLRLAARPAGTA
jgi:hypothetical protein